jgi:hypothetical protein
MRNVIICGTKRNELSNCTLRIAAAHKDASPRGTSPAAALFVRSMRQAQGRYRAFMKRSYRLCVTGAARDLREAITSLAWAASHVCWQPDSHRLPHAFGSRS